MKSFTDAKGRTWNIEIALDEVERIQEVAGVDFGDLKNLFENLAKALGDTRTFGLILWALVGEQVIAKNLTPKEFKAGFNGDTVRAAVDCIAEEVVRFFPSASGPILRLGAAVKARAEIARPMALAQMEAALVELEAGGLDEALGLTTPDPSASSNTAIDSPESSASTPAA